MYNFVSSWVKPARFNTPYSNINLNDVPLKNILTDYLDGYIVLTNPGLVKPVYLDITKMRSANVPVKLNQTLRTWLRGIGNLTLDASAIKPTYETKSVTSRDAILAGFTVSMCEPNKSPDTDASVGNKSNLYVVNQVRDNTNLQRRSLTTVNGLLHLNHPYDVGVQITSGGASMLHAESNNVGVISFEYIGDVLQIPITEDILHRYTPSTPYSDTIMLDLDIDLTGKSIILSLGGYMFVSPSFLNVASDTTGLLEVRLNEIDIPLKLLKSLGLIDLTSLGISESDFDDREFGKLRIADVMSDIVIKKWLTLSQSFVVVVDSPSLTVEIIPSYATGIYGSFETHINPFLPLMDHYGRLPEYWVKQQNDMWIIQIKDPIYKPPIHDTAKRGSIAFINNITAEHAWFLQPPSFLNIVSTRKLSP